MMSTNVALRLLAAACLVTGVAFAGGAMAASGAPELTVTATPASIQTDTAEKPSPVCARKVKVVYAGYGEADRAGCVAVKAAD